MRLPGLARLPDALRHLQACGPASGIRTCSYSRKQRKQAEEKLKANKALLDKWGAPWVHLPDTGVDVVLYPCCHALLKDVTGAQELIQGLQPDRICVELCPERIEQISDLRRTLSHRNVFLPQDIVKNLSKQGHTPDKELLGLEMVVSVLEGDRHRVPVVTVDRARSITEARMQDGLSDYFAIKFQKLVQIWDHAAVLIFAGEHVPVDRLKKAFSRGLQLPWRVRQRILDSAITPNGVQVVPARVLREQVDEFVRRCKLKADLTLEDSKMEALEDLKPDVMPHDLLERLGPESTFDLFERVIRAERDVVLAHEIKVWTGPAVRDGLGNAGPLVFAALGAAHVRPVERLLRREPLEKLKPGYLAALQVPRVPDWKKVPLSRILS